MNYDESVLVFSSIIFTIVLYILMLIKGPRISILKNTTYFDKTKLPTLFKILLVVVLLSIGIGFIVTQRLSLILQYAGINLLVSIIMVPSLTILRGQRPNKKRKDI